MGDAAHCGSAVLLEVREGDSGGQSGGFCNRSSYGAGDRASWSLWRASGRGGRVRWAGAAEPEDTGDALAHQWDSAVGGSGFDDHFRRGVLPVSARLERPGRAVDGRMGVGRFSFARDILRGRGAGDVRRAAPGSGVGTFRARIVGAYAGAGAWFPRAASHSVWHGAGGLYAVGAAAGRVRHGV